MRVYTKSYTGRGNARCGHTEIYEQNQQKEVETNGQFHHHDIRAIYRGNTVWYTEKR